MPKNLVIGDHEIETKDKVPSLSYLSLINPNNFLKSKIEALDAIKNDNFDDK